MCCTYLQRGKWTITKGSVPYKTVHTTGGCKHGRCCMLRNYCHHD